MGANLHTAWCWLSCVLLTPDWVTAIGTVSAVALALLLALYGQQIARWRFHPVLRFKALVQRPDADKVSRWRQEGNSVVVLGEAWYFRLAISNEGNDAAREV